MQSHKRLYAFVIYNIGLDKPHTLHDINPKMKYSDPRLKLNDLLSADQPAWYFLEMLRYLKILIMTMAQVKIDGCPDPMPGLLHEYHFVCPNHHLYHHHRHRHDRSPGIKKA